MRRVVLYMFTTLDGFIAGPNGEFDDYEPSAEEMDFALEFFGSVDTILFGRVTYQGFASYWDSLDVTDEHTTPADAEFARIFRRTRRVVFSRTLTAADDMTLVVHDGIAATVDGLKRQRGRDIALICGPELLSTLLGLGLVDELAILVKPSVLGRGKPLFGDVPGKLPLRLMSTRVFGSGVVLHHYAPEYAAAH